MSVRALIVEDEPLARRTLHEFIAGVDWIECVGEAADGKTAVRMVDQLRPDLLFLDVRMPELNGLEVLERIAHRPAVVFTTAYDSYAVAAFELEALDYLVKPFGRERFEAAMARVKRSLDDSGTEAPSLERVRAAFASGPVKRLYARAGDRIVPISVAEIRRIVADDDRAVAHVGNQLHVLNLSLNELERRLDPDRFLRIHRSHIVNLDRVKSMSHYDERRLQVTLDDGSEIIASRAGSHKLRGLAD